ncbi:MAG: hypothetical protein V4511_13670 [Bacteroidota bacterium]
MNLKKKYKFYSKVAFTMAIIMLVEIIYPSAALALTSGPGSPEFSSFEPVATTSMVNEFNGGFTYNIPVLDIPGANGGGYACALSYHSGETVESESSWVGGGWSLNPGAINRNKRGFADDSNGDPVTYKNDVPANWTVSAQASVGNLETFSIDLPVSLSGTLRYNNYRGFSLTKTFGYTAGIVSLGYSSTDGQGSFSVSVNPAGLLAKPDKDQKLDDIKSEYKAAKDGPARKAALDKFTSKKKEKQKGASSLSALGKMGSAYGMHSMGEDLRATSVSPYTGQSFNLEVSALIDPLVFPVGGEFGFNASFSKQKNKESRDVEAFGYMYSSGSLQVGKEATMMDYYVEKESMYNKRDRYMSIPYSNADMYAVTGEGVGGGFRLYNKTVGEFFPNEVKSETPIVQLGVSADIGLDVGIGANLGVGYQTLEVKRDWEQYGSATNGNTDNFNFMGGAKNEGTFFRFSNDMGGSLTYTKSAKAVSADLYPVNDVPGLKSVRPHVPDDIHYAIADVMTENGESRSGRSSYIGYHTNTEMAATSGSGKTYYAYEKSTSANDFITRASVPHGIGELAVFNEEGNRYLYGLPVYSRKEKSMQYDLRGVPGTGIQNNFVAYKNISNPLSQVGEINQAPYATSYLLTEITTPDYVDRSLNGPSDDDFGGYTKFSYSRAYGSNNKVTGSGWYKWRIPYTGLSYNANDLTDNLDDMGSISSGEKEVYYAKTIETKTHVAVFVTNTTTDFMLGGKTINGSHATRQDGVEAADDLTAAMSSTAKGVTSSNPSLQKQQMLERIELYAKPIDGSVDYKLVKTTRFEYDYSTCGNVPNNLGMDVDKNGDDASTTGLPDINANKGKLTLKKVWFEYEGITNAKISPYKFDYQYPVIAGNNGLPSAYSSIVNYGDNLSEAEENPAYSPFNLDRWGNPQPEGETRHDELKSFLDQTVDLAAFDPAAWQMKKITLPSGGEILVQYEQNDYMYVQDKNALAMVSLKPASSFINPFNQSVLNKFYLNVEDDLGVSGPTDLQNLATKIRHEFQDKKIYFKFLYALLGGNPQLGSCNSDYVKGYVDVKTVGVDADGLFIKLGDGNAFDRDTYELPRNVCIDYVKTEKGGKLKPFGNCNASDGGIPEGNDPLAIAQQLIFRFATLRPMANAATCLDLKETLSYLRIPLLHAKKGGGIRVKRILMYDKGIESGDENLYGSEYIYKTIDGESSGVATNEPSAGKEESALVTFLPKRGDQSIPNRLVAGKDKEQFEGPIGEYLLPSPSVGYSRVAVKNIHSGKTNTGFSVNEYFTAKDYPFNKYYNTTEVSGYGVENTGIEQRKDWLLIPASFVNISINNLWLTQGYRFVVNEMHGQPKSISTYAGDYNALGEPDKLLLSSQQVFNYYEPGEKIPVMTDVNTITLSNPGKETEVVMERKAVEDISSNGNIEVDFTVGLLFPVFPVYLSSMPSVSYSESKLRTHVTTKIIRYPVVQKSITTYQDGIYHLTENIAFSPYTGKPLLTKTTDGYDALDLQQSTDHNGTYLSYSIPAAKEYKEMGQKAANERMVLDFGEVPWTSVSCTTSTASGIYTMKFAASPGTVCNAMNALNRGDLILIDGSPGSNNGKFFHVDEKNGSEIKILPAKLYNGTSTIYLVNGVSTIEVIKSGRTNQLNTLAGSFTTYGINQNTTVDTLNASELAPRQTFVDNLNSALGSIVGGGSDTISFTLGMMNAMGTCSTISRCINLRVSAGVLSSSLGIDPACKTRPLSDCSSVMGNPSGYFDLDRKTGQISYFTNDNPCNPISIPCFNFCPNVGLSLNNVVAATASTFDYTWPFDTANYKFSTQPFGPFNDYETGVKGKWRMASAFAYNSAVASGSKQGTTERNYKDAGVFPMTLFNWKDASYNDSAKWVRTSTVCRYSPNGEALEERDAIGIRSSAKYGYKGMLPYLIAQNSEYRASQFESFENVYTAGLNKLEEGLTIISSQIDNTKAHSGSSSFKILNTSSSTAGTPSTANLVLKPFKLTSQLIANGLELKVWVKDPGYTNLPVSAIMKDSASGAALPVNFSKVAQTGEWTLYSAYVISFPGSGSARTLTPTIFSGYPVSATASPIWIDDVRIQPFNAQVMTYVYDSKTLKLLASFDDQHFGMYYQYNAEGKLVRKKIETEKGLKTIQETQYHTPVVVR